MPDTPAPPRGPVARLASALALAGGATLLATALLTTYSVVQRWITRQPVPGDFELVQLGCAIGVAAFLPWCQMRRGNIIVDFFTARLPPRAQDALDGVGALLLALVMALVAWRATFGAITVYDSGERAMISRYPQWIGYAAIVPPLALTGERTLPDVPEENYWYRRHEAVYQWIAERTWGRRVVDLACGEGYGSAILARTAASVVGVDANPEAFEHARLKYTTDKVTFERDMIEKLVNAYFTEISPVLPVITQAEFVASPSPPPILLYSICLVAAARREVPQSVFDSIRYAVNNVIKSEDILSTASIANVQSLLILCMVGDCHSQFVPNALSALWVRLGTAIRMVRWCSVRGLHATC